MAWLLLVACTAAVEPEAAASTLAVQRPTATALPASTATVAGPVSPLPTAGAEQGPVAIILAQPTYLHDGDGRLHHHQPARPACVRFRCCIYGSGQRVQADDVIPLKTHFFDPADLFKPRIRPGESLACGWRQDVFQDPSADGVARYLNAGPENGRRLPVPPGDYRVWLRTYPSEEEVGQVSKGQALVSPHFTILPAPFREQLVIKLWKSEYRLGEPIGYNIRNVGKPREWRGPINLRGTGCGTVIVERLDGSREIQRWTASEEKSRNRIEAHHSRTCTLDPQLWTDTASDSILLEPGTYRIGMSYELDAVTIGVGKREHQVFSDPFTVADMPLPAVTVSVGKLEYALGEPVDLTITNSSEAPIYTYDNCGEPPVWWVHGNWINPLVMRITEEWIPAQPLAPGESWSCTWQQKSYDTLPQGAEGFGSERSLAVPPGTYQLRLIYFLTDPEDDERPAGERDPGLTTVSRRFVIGEP